jgi:hypothetical protein
MVNSACATCPALSRPVNLASRSISKTLKEAGLLTNRREGRWIYDALDRETLGELRDLVGTIGVLKVAAFESLPVAVNESLLDNLRLFLPDPDGEESYPVVSFSWRLLYQRSRDQQKSAALKQFIRWGLSDGQSSSAELGYVPLPPEVVALSCAALEEGAR